ncbi:MAG: hypothetical protein M3N17_05020 [Actinomycetota bacterium]|nr:hypothetical protein [Actinomycetota bacterium]
MVSWPRRPRPELADGERERLLGEADAVLDRNWRGASTVPEPDLYPHQWCWDAGFLAIGRSWADQARAQQELESLFRGQWGNGMVPHIVFDPAVAPDAYFPGPSFWRSERAGQSPGGVSTSGITQPALHARAALEIHRNAGDRDEALAFLRRLYPKLVAQHDYLARCRDPNDNGLVAMIHPWESGMDNSPAWDGELADLSIPPGALPRYERRDLAHADPRDRPTDEAYDRFVYLAMTYRDSGYDDAGLLSDSPFLVEDPMFNAICLWSLHALAEIAGLVGADPAPHRTAAARLHDALLERLWDPAAGRFFGRDPRGARRGPQNTIISFMPLLDPDLPAATVDTIVAAMASPAFHPPDPSVHFLVPSLDVRAREFDPRRYWRGPVWLNTDWLLWRGLSQHGRTTPADDVAASMVGLVRRSGYREYFNPFGGEGYGGAGFSWSAALLIDLLRRTG